MFEVKLSICLLLALLTFYCSYLLPTSAVLQLSDDTAMEKDFERLKTQFLPSAYATTNFTMKDVKQLLRNKCSKVGLHDDNIYEQLEQAANHFLECANSIANLTQVLDEIEEARPTGELDMVFQKYCERRPRAERCLRDFNAQLLPCLTPKERLQNAVLMRTITALLGFICYKNGDQIAMFIAEEGPECIEANKENIGNCMNATFAAYWPKQTDPASLLANMTDMSDLVLSPKHCIDLHDFEECVLGYLEQCNEITPANIIESMFKYVRNETKCQHEIDEAAVTVKRVKIEAMRANAANRSLLVNAVGLSAALIVVIWRWLQISYIL